MHVSADSKRRLAQSSGLFLGIGLALLVVAAWAPSDSVAQKAAPKKEEKEEREKPKTPVKSKADEIEDTEVDLDETTPIDLSVEVRTATPGPIRDFLKSLATPHEDLTTPGGRVDHVQPFARYLGPAPVFSGTLSVTRIEASGKRVKLKPISKRDVASVTHYEEIVVRAVAAFLEKGEKPRLDSLVAAEKTLIFALRFHATGRKNMSAHAAEWKKMEAGLRLKWLEVRRERAAVLADAARWDDAFRLADQVARDKESTKLLKTLSAVVDVQLDLPRLALRKAEKSGKLEDYVLARSRLATFEQSYSQTTGADTIRKGLKARASELMSQGLALAKTDKSAAIDKLRDATKVWPDLEGLQDQLRALDNEHPVLYVGVHALPKHLSPATAWTDPEKQAVELLFDSLLKRVPEGRGLWRYHPSLAVGRPRVIHLGRELSLDSGAKWSDGTRLTAADLRYTVSLLKNPELPGRNTEWGKMMDDPRVEGGPNQVCMTLRNGFLDPLALMTFKILPRTWARDKLLKKADDPAFAENPLGSGPFFLDSEARRDPSTVVFTANPHYQERTRRSGQPRIHEIRFLVSQNPVQDLLAKPTRLHLLLDLPTTRVKDLIDGGFNPKNIVTRASPRVYFLAVNHARDNLQNQDLRKAIAHAIDREAILASFRAGFQGLDAQQHLMKESAAGDEKLHPALNGPYPVGSWASNPNVKPSLYDLALAKSKAADALKRLGDVALKLKFPSDDPRAEEACKSICAQVAKLGTRIKIEPQGLAPADFRETILERKYELAYCHHDYTSDAYWLWPLFDPSRNARDPGGSNYLRYENDDQLDSLFGQAMNRRDFAEIRKITHEIHAHIIDKMPLIPLWQLHTHIAAHSQLKTGEIDPLLVFTNVETWQLQK